MVYNATTFSYNRAIPRVSLYRGYIGRVKDRCVSDTCVFFVDFGFLLRHPFHLRKPLPHCSASVSRRPEVKIFSNGRLRLIRRFPTCASTYVVRSKGKRSLSGLAGQYVVKWPFNHPSGCSALHFWSQGTGKRRFRLFRKIDDFKPTDHTNCRFR